MSILPLLDNALFIKNWRERMRSHVVLGYIVIAFCVVSLIYINAYLNPGVKNYLLPEFQAHWLNTALFSLTIAQGVLLCLIV